MNHSKLFFSLLGRILFADICKFGKKACFLNGTIPTARKKENCTHRHTHTLSLSHAPPLLDFAPDPHSLPSAEVQVLAPHVISHSHALC